MRIYVKKPRDALHAYANARKMPNLLTLIPFISADYIPAFRSVLKNRGSIPWRGKRHGALPAYFNGYRTVKLAIYVRLVPRLRVSGAKPQLPYMPSRYEQAQLYTYKLTFGLFQKNYYKAGWRSQYSAYATNRTIRGSTAGRDKKLLFY